MGNLCVGRYGKATQNRVPENKVPENKGPENKVPESKQRCPIWPPKRTPIWCPNKVPENKKPNLHDTSAAKRYTQMVCPKIKTYI